MTEQGPGSPPRTPSPERRTAGVRWPWFAAGGVVVVLVALGIPWMAGTGEQPGPTDPLQVAAGKEPAEPVTPQPRKGGEIVAKPTNPSPTPPAPRPDPKPEPGPVAKPANLPPTSPAPNPEPKPEPGPERTGGQPTEKKELPGADGKRIEYIGKPDPGILLGNIYVVERFDLKAKEKTFPTTFPSGTKMLDLVIEFAYEPQGEIRVGWEVQSNAGPLALLQGSTAFLRAAPPVMLIPVIPGKRLFADGPYRMTVTLNYKRIAVLNWSVGKSANPAPGISKTAGAGERPAPAGPSQASGAPEGKKAPAKDDVPAGEIHRFEGHTKGVNSVACSADGHRALSASDDGTLRLWDVDSGKELLKIQANAKGVRWAALSADGRRALSIGGDPDVRLWDLETGKEVRRFKDVGEGEHAVVFSPDGRRALSGNYYGLVRLWDLETGEAIRSFKGHSNAINGLAFTPDGKRVLSCSHDLTVRLWDAETGKELRQFSGHTGYVHCLAVSTDGRKVLSGSGGRLGQEPDLFFNDPPRPKMITDRDTDLRLWDLDNGKEVRKYAGHRIYVNSMAFSPDGRRALSSNGGALIGFEGGTIMGAFGGGDNLLHLWDVDGGKELQSFKGHTELVRCVVFLGDGRRALSASADKTVRLWGLPPSEPSKP
jgi:WD40 repeat protein